MISITLKGAIGENFEEAKEMLRRIIGKEALIDEYDVPLDKAYRAGYYDSMVEFIRVLFGSAFKTEEGISTLAIPNREIHWIYVQQAFARFSIRLNFPAAFDNACKKALEQIHGRNYEEALVDDGMKTIYKYGIACYKKCCKVVLG